MGKPYQPKDAFFHKAKADGFRARSAYKLDEIAQKFGLFRAGGKVLDLGAAPGGFLQIIAAAVGPKGKVIGVDRVAIPRLPFAHVTTFVADVLAEDFEARLEEVAPFELDAVISDLAPKTTGIRSTDEARSLALATRALEVAKAKGRVGSHFVAKLFMGGDFEAFRAQVREAFGDVKVVRPQATRGQSMEIYLVGMRLRAGRSTGKQSPGEIGK
jgi:23S rRNA (uridine2552-2'-O)-methyltransferase